jgi:hypothetical protein
MRVVRLDRGEGGVMTGLVAFAVGIALGFVLAVGISLAMQPRGRPFGDDPDS